MITVLVEPGTLPPGGTVALPESEAHHLRVRRAAEGVAVRLADGAGSLGEGTLLAGGAVAVGRITAVARPAGLWLAVAAGDKERWDWLAEKAGETGVTDLLPVESERVAGVASRLRAGHLERLQRRAREAIKQSGAAWAPLVHPPVGFDDLCSRSFEGVRWLADPEGGLPGALRPDGPVLVLVGPEGGLTGRERRVALDGGFEPVRLGPHVLRFETAAVAAAVAVMLRRGEPNHG